MKKRISAKIYAIMVIFVALLSLNGFSKNDQPTIIKTFEINQPGTLEASSSGGSVLVKTHDEAKVIIHAFVRKNGKVLSPQSRDLNDILDEFNIDFSKSGSTIKAVVKRKSRFNFWNRIGISLTVIVPREMSCDVSSSGGSVKVYGVAGTHNISSSGGSVKLENTAGTTKAKSSGGSVSATKHKGDISLTSSGGGVRLNKAKGNVYARSSGGSVKLEDINGEVEASSSGGSVSVNGKAPFVKAKSSGGSVRVNIAELSKEMHLVSSGGGVYATIQDGEKLGMDLDLSSGKVNIDLHNFSGSSEKNRVKGKMNGGGIPVYMRASGGNVNVEFED